jgi:lipopolysaccharide export system permease protein
MIRKLDIFIIRKYLSTFVFTALIFTMIAVVIDFSEKLEKFIEEPTTLHEIIFQYYLAFIPQINWLLWPLFALISVIFFTSRMAANSEVLSILNAGISYNRFLRPYLLAALIIGLIHMVGNHFFIPMLNKNKIEFEAKYINKEDNSRQNNNVHIMLSPDQKVFVRYFSRIDSTAKDMRIETFNQDKLTEIFVAKEARYIGKTKEWEMKNITIHSFQGQHETITIDPVKAVKKKLNLTPNDFYTITNYKQTLTTPALYSFIRKEDARGTGYPLEYIIELHRRTADSATIIILTIMAVSVSSRKVRGGVGLHLAFGVAMGALFMVMSKFSVTFAQSNIVPPIIGVWIPNLVFFAFSLWLMSKAQK